MSPSESVTEIPPESECIRPPTFNEIPESVKATAHALFAQGQKIFAISKQIGVNPNTLHSWARRGQWKVARSQAKAITHNEEVQKEGKTTKTTVIVTKRREDPLSQASGALRADFADILSKHTTEAKRIAGTANVKRLRAIGEALEPFARIAKIVHGWGAESVGGMVAAEYLSADHERQAAVTAITNVSPSDAQVQQPQGQEVAKQPEATPVDPATLP